MIGRPRKRERKAESMMRRVSLGLRPAPALALRRLSFCRSVHRQLDLPPSFHHSWLCPVTYRVLRPPKRRRRPLLSRQAPPMASNLPIPLPPRTPTPPLDDLPSAPNHGSNPGALDQDSLSPLKDTFAQSRSGLDTEDRKHLSPTRATFNLNPSESAVQNHGQSDPDPSGPFNFKTSTMAKSPVIKSVSC